MARKVKSETAQQVISMAIGAAEALATGVDVAKRAIAETARVAEDAGTEIGGALARMTKPSRNDAASADPRVPKRRAKARGRRRPRRGPA